MERPARQDLPRVLVFTSALLCGLFLALATHITLTAAGAGLTSVVRDLFSTTADQVRSALAWWAIGIAGCLGSWGAVLALRAASPSQRLLRTGLAFIFFCVLAAAGRAAAAAPSGGASTLLLANLSAMAFGTFMAFFAAHFGSRS